ncbi:MAG TPA: hypothetical protein VIA80_05315 [Hyphomonadaceae bacterium]
MRSRVLHAVRLCAEPFYFHHNRLETWRPHASLEVFNAMEPAERFGVNSAIIAPAYLPGGVIGAVVWASPDDALDVPAIFAQCAAELHALTLKFVATHGYVGRIARS